MEPKLAASLEDGRALNAVLSRLGERLKEFPGYAKVRRVILTLEPWTVDNGLLTPTLKVKRKQVLERYEKDVTRVYEQGPAAVRQRVA